MNRMRTISVAMMMLIATVTPGVAEAMGASSRATTSSPTALAPSPNLVDRAAAAGINWPSTPSWHVAPIDYDDDGDLDFSMSLHMKNAGELRRNNGDGTFTRVAYSSDPATTIMPRPTEQGGLVDRHACTWADFDRNGLPDLYCSAGRYRSNRYKAEGINNELFLQVTAGAFREAATASGVGEPCTRGRHVAAFDVNGDGWQDLFLGAQKERSDSDDPCNDEAAYPYNEQSKVFVNRGRSASGAWLGFRTAPEWNVTQVNTGNRFALPWDYDRDGRVDLLTGTFEGQRGYLHRNTGSGFVEVARSGQVSVPVANGVALADLTGDGIEDLVFADDAGFGYRAGTATGVSGTTVRLGTVPTGSRGGRVAVGDINGDGRLDVYGLVVSQSGSGNPADAVFVRTSAGGWVSHEVPAAGGDANSVAAVTVRGRAQFVVLNGGNDESDAPGPVQLIAWVP